MNKWITPSGRVVDLGADLLKKRDDEIAKLRRELRLANKNSIQKTPFMQKIRYHDSERSSGVRWWVFQNVGMTDEQICWMLETMGWNIDEEEHRQTAYDCTGSYCQSGIEIIRSKSRVLVKIHWSYDV